MDFYVYLPKEGFNICIYRYNDMVSIENEKTLIHQELLQNMCCCQNLPCNRYMNLSFLNTEFGEIKSSNPLLVQISSEVINR